MVLVVRANIDADFKSKSEFSIGYFLDGEKDRQISIYSGDVAFVTHSVSVKQNVTPVLDVSGQIAIRNTSTTEPTGEFSVVANFYRYVGETRINLGVSQQFTLPSLSKRSSKTYPFSLDSVVLTEEQKEGLKKFKKLSVLLRVEAPFLQSTTRVQKDFRITGDPDETDEKFAARVIDQDGNVMFDEFSNKHIEATFETQHNLSETKHFRLQVYKKEIEKELSTRLEVSVTDIYLAASPTVSLDGGFDDVSLKTSILPSVGESTIKEGDEFEIEYVAEVTSSQPLIFLKYSITGNVRAHLSSPSVYPEYSKTVTLAVGVKNGIVNIIGSEKI